MKQRVWGLIIPLILLTFSGLAQKYVLAPPTKIKWISFNELANYQQQEKRPVLIDVYTDWCGWCKKLDVTTYADPNIINYVNQSFYAIKFDAETHDTITYLGIKYFNKNAAKKSTHDLAVHLMGNNLSYPTSIFLNKESNPALVVPGYQESNDMAPFLVYFAENLQNTANINDFNADFHKAFGGTKNDSIAINWMPLNQALILQKIKPKKLFVHLKNSNVISDRVMSNSTLVSNDVINELNKNYYCIDFDVYSADTISFQNNLFVNANPGIEIHQFAKGLLQNEVGFPAVVILNEQQLVLAPIKQYLTHDHLVALLVYFKEDIYKTKSFAEFAKERYGK